MDKPGVPCHVNQGRIQDLKLGVAQMDWKIWKPGGIDCINISLYIYIYIKYDICQIRFLFHIKLHYLDNIVMKNRIWKNFRGGGGAPGAPPSKSALVNWCVFTVLTKVEDCSGIPVIISVYNRPLGREVMSMRATHVSGAFNAPAPCHGDTDIEGTAKARRQYVERAFAVGFSACDSVRRR